MSLQIAHVCISLQSRSLQVAWCVAMPQLATRLIWPWSSACRLGSQMGRLGQQRARSILAAQCAYCGVGAGCACRFRAPARRV
eukprot:6883140-Alexandrium_andersonii.AAC.1